MKADVYKGDVLAAALERHDDHTEFRYLPEYEGPEVATTLPRGHGPVVTSPGHLPAFFVGLLPEGRRLSALRRALKVSADDEFSLVLAVGANTVGDVRVVPAGTIPADPQPLVTDWEESDLQALFERSVGGDYDRTAIPGEQPKLSGRVISFPTSSTWGDVIVKLDPPDFPAATLNEAAMLGVADASGFTVPGHEVVVDAVGSRGLVVSRFDRVEKRRLAVEDGCQVLGRVPADKYLIDTVQVIAGLAAQCDAPKVAALQLLERFVLSYLVGDGDLHARNLAIHQSPDGLWTPTPVFDLVSTVVYGDTTLAAPFNGHERAREMGRRRLLEAGSELGVAERAMERSIDRLVAVVPAAAIEALETLPIPHEPTLRKAQQVVRRRAELLAG